MAKVTNKLSKSIHALEKVVKSINSSEPLSYKSLGNAGFILWWVTYTEAMKLLSSQDNGQLSLPRYITGELATLVAQGPNGCSLAIRHHPLYQSTGSFNQYDLVPESLPVDATDFPDAIMLPFSMLSTVEALAGIVTDLSGSEDLSFLYRVNATSSNDPVLNEEEFMIWWLTEKEAYHVLRSLLEGSPDKVPFELTSCIGTIAHSFTGGYVDIPMFLTQSPYYISGERLDDLDPQAPGEECMRDGILILASQMDKIHLTTGIFTLLKGGDPVVKPHLPAVRAQDNDKYCVWWLGLDEIKVLNDSIRQGVVRLPSYLLKAIRDLEDIKTLGSIVIPLTVEVDLHQLPEVVPGESEELIGIIFHRTDLYNVSRYCGAKTTVELRTIVPDFASFNATPYTDDEIRSMFITHLTDTIKYWVGQHPDDPERASSGAVFSTLSLLDGCSMDLPGFALVPLSTKEDNDYMAEVGFRPWPVPPAGLMDQLVDIGGELHSQLSREQPKVIHSKNHVTLADWDKGVATGRWAYICLVHLNKTRFITDRFEHEHAGVVLGNAWRDLSAICLKNGAVFVQGSFFYVDNDYIFRFATDDGVVFDNMIKDLSGYTLEGSF